MKTVVIQIGNSDDRLSQVEWSRFATDLKKLAKHYGDIHFYGGPSNWKSWQNLCCVVSVPEERCGALKMSIGLLRAGYRQDSAAVVIGDTEFV